MSRWRKHVTQGLDEDIEAIETGQAVARVHASRGGNLMEVELANGRRTLCMLPQKFNRKLWVKRGGFVLVEENEKAAEEGTKVTGTIISILYEKQIKQIKRISAWPSEFDVAAACNLVNEDLGEPDSPGSEDEPSQDGTHASIVKQEEEIISSMAGVNISKSMCMDRGHTHNSEVIEGGNRMEGGPAATLTDHHDCNQDDDEEEEEEEDDRPPLFENTNRRVIYHEVSESESDS